jgi:hypothetical protein
MNGVAIAPSAGSPDAFCSSNSTLGFDGWVRGSITLVVPVAFGANTLTVQGRLNSGATGGWFGDTATVIEK